MSNPKYLQLGNISIGCADDWLNQNEDEEAAHKTRNWLLEEPTEKQISVLPKKLKLDFNLTRYGRHRT